MSEHNFPRLFSPPIIEHYKDTQDDITLSTLTNIIQKQQDIINTQGKLITKHETDINSLHTSLQEIKHLLNGRQFMRRGLSFESDNTPIDLTD